MKKHRYVFRSANASLWVSIDTDKGLLFAETYLSSWFGKTFQIVKLSTITPL